MVDLSAEGISFSGGPFGEIQGVLDKFGLNFNDLISQFMDRYNSFKADLDLRPLTLPKFDLRPISLPRFPGILQIGSKMPSMQYSLELNEYLWDKLAARFQSLTFNGVKIPNIPYGFTFADTFPRGNFPGEVHIQFIAYLIKFLDQLTKCARPLYIFQVELFLPHLAVAFGFAPSFSDPKALSFSVDMLFMPNFGPDLSFKLLDSLRSKFALERNLFLWDKLHAAFPNPTFNGDDIPNVPTGLTFAIAFPRGDFPGTEAGWRYLANFRIEY